jgi:hypothetical protein
MRTFLAPAGNRTPAVQPVAIPLYRLNCLGFSVQRVGYFNCLFTLVVHLFFIIFYLGYYLLIGDRVKSGRNLSEEHTGPIFSVEEWVSQASCKQCCVEVTIIQMKLDVLTLKILTMLSLSTACFKIKNSEFFPQGNYGFNMSLPLDIDYFPKYKMKKLCVFC